MFALIKVRIRAAFGDVLQANCIMGPLSSVSLGLWGRWLQPMTPLLLETSGSQESDFSGLGSWGPLGTSPASKWGNY